MRKRRLLIADDHAMIRAGLKAVAESGGEWEVCGEASDGRTAVAMARRLRPDVVVLDVSMPEMNGIDAARRIVADLPGVAVLFLTMHQSEALVREAAEAGARGLVLKNDASAEFGEALRAVAAGRLYFSPAVAGAVLRGAPAESSSGTGSTGAALAVRLSPRERELVQLLAEGKSNKEAAAILGISENTVETHRKNVMSKLKFRSASDLVRYAIRNQWVSP